MLHIICVCSYRHLLRVIEHVVSRVDLGELLHRLRPRVRAARRRPRPHVRHFDPRGLHLGRDLQQLKKNNKIEVNVPENV